MSFREWEKIKWGELCFLEYGKGLKDYKNSKEEIPVFGTNGLIGHTDKVLSNRDGVVIGRKGAYRGVHYSKVPFYVIDTAFYLKLIDSSKLDMNFAYYHLLTKDMNSMDSGSAIPSTSRNDFYSMVSIIPPIEEQKAIAHILSTLDQKIEVNNQINKTLEKMAQAIFKQWFVDFEFPNEAGEPYQSSGGEMVESELGLVPKGWEVGSFTDYIDVLSGGTPKTKNKEYWDGEIPFFTPKDTNGTYCICTEKCLTVDGLNSCNSRLYDENTVFITARGTVGKIAMAGVKMAMNQSCYALVGKSEMNQFYVWFQIKGAIEKLQRRASGSVFDAIIVDTFKAIKIVKPQTAHIEKFKNMVEPIFENIQLKYIENEELKNIRDVLLPKLMSGNLRV